MDSDLLTMPPVVDTEEERRKREEAAVGTRMPPVPGPSGSGLVKSYAPGSPEYDAGLKETEPKMPAVKPAPLPSTAPAPTPAAMPPVKLGPSDLSPTAKAPMATAAAPAVHPGAMPPVPVGPQQQRYEDISKQPAPELHGWKKALDTIGSIFPIGRAVEEAIPGSPQNYNAKLNQAALRAAKEQSIGAGQREAESATAKAQFETPEKRRAYLAQHPDEFEGASDFQKNDFVLAGKFPQREPAEEKPHDVVKAYGDALAQGDEKKAAELLPRVKQFIENTQKPEKEAKENKAVAGTVAGKPAWGVQTDKGWVDPQTQKSIPNFQPAPNYAQVAPGMRSTNVIRNGQLMAIHPDELQPGDVLAGASAGEHAMGKQAQFQEIHSGIDNLRSAIKNLDKPFTPEQIGKLTLAMKHTSDPTVFQTELETLLGTQQLTTAQEDLVIWMGHLNERALSLRNIAGMGQGSDSMRAAIQAILPGVKSGSTEMMNKQLAAFENQVTKLEKGVPKMPGSEDGASKDYGPAPQGKADGSTGTMKVDGKDVKIKIQGGRIVAQ